MHDGATGTQIAGPLIGPDITAVSLNGELFGASSGRVTRYSLDDLASLGDFAGAHGDVNTLQFSDDGRILLATSNDQSASVYDVETGVRLGDPISTAAPLIYPAFLRPDGGAVAVTDAYGVLIWDLDTANLLEAACRVAGRNLTATEWASHLGDLGDHHQTCTNLPQRVIVDRVLIRHAD